MPPKATPPTASLTRMSERGSADRADLDALLDSGFVGVLATTVDGEPWVVPMLYGRDGDRILLHGSTGAGALRQVAAGAPAAFCVVAVDGLVVAESTFESSANYRSAVIRGRLQPLRAQERTEALREITEGIIPGRNAEVRPSTAKEEAATMGLTLAIEADNWLLKSRDGLPGDPGEPVDVWCGVIPLALTAGKPEAAPWSVGPVPASVANFVAAHPAP